MIFNSSTCKFGLILFLILCHKTVYAQADFNSVNITDRDGLPQNKIKSIVKDSLGYIWIGTQNGIAQYNGYRFKTYTALNDIEITSIFLSDQNDLWLGTHQGLFFLDRTHDLFDKVSLGDIRHLTASGDEIYFITPDRMYNLRNGKVSAIELEEESYLRQVVLQSKKLYLGQGKNHGLVKGEIIKGRLSIKQHLLGSKVITCLKTINDQVWVGTSDGQLYHLTDDAAMSIALQNNHPVKDIVLHNNQLWVGTDGNGVFIIDDKEQIVAHLTHNQGEKNLIGSNNIQSILSIDKGSIWVGTYDAGVYALSSNQLQFQKLQDLHSTDLVNLSESATAFYQDHSGNLLLGTPGGFVKIDPSSGQSIEIGFDKCQKLLGGSKVLSILETYDEHILIGTYDGGMGYFTKNLEHIKTFYPFGNEGQEQNISFLFNLPDHRVLVNSMYKGMVAMDLQTGFVTPIALKESGEKVFKFQSQALRKFKNELYAYIFGKSLYRINTTEAMLELVLTPPLPLNDFYLNSDGTFWLATRGEGLILTSPDGETIRQIDIEDGLPSNFLLRVEKDHTNHLWISSISGLSKIDASGEVTTFDHRHGLPSREFTPFTSTVLQNNNLLFGTVKGFVLTNTNANPQGSSPPKTIISDITFQNQSIKTLGDELLTSPVETLVNLELPFYRNSFTVHFFNDDYSLPKFNKFKYRMLGLEKDWIDLEENTQTTYTNLSPGNYQFQVSSSNKYGTQNDQPTTLNIFISPPWYMSWWAYLVYLLVGIGLGYIIYRIMLYRTHMLKELEFSEYKIQTIRDLNEKKLQFFTNITHDFKTPLTLISAPLEELLEDQTIGDRGKNNLGLIKRNSDRLYHLIIDLLDFRKINNPDTLQLEVSETDMARFLQDLYEPFHSACVHQEILLTLDNQCSPPVFIDTEKVKRILWNVLSNALKFTPRNGKININCSLDGDKILLSIVDTGKGMTESEIKLLFNRYYQTGHEVENKEFGTGLGMAIVKGLINSHRGEINVVSQPGSGTSFHIELPWKKESYSAAELNTKPKGNYRYLPPVLSTREPIQTSVPGRYNLPTVLICEDNPELNEFLVQIFERDYKVVKCFDGEEGFSLALKKTPDLIISDVMMPKMDGYEFCKKIKSNIDTSHTPVILLTANSSLDKQIKGMSYGADIYITKPFKTEFLLASAVSILENRQKLREKFQGLQKINEPEESITRHDQEFMNKLRDFVNANLTNPDLSIELLAEVMNCSKSSLIRKVKALTGITPMTFLRTYRLNTAYELLTKENLTVSEVSYKTGFSDPNYFATSFKKHFGKNPSQVG